MAILAHRAVNLVLVAGMALGLSACGMNSIPTKEENVKAKWGDVENQYQRRSDLIPNLVASVKGAAAQERNVLREVTEARAGANRITLTTEQLRDPAAVDAYAAAQSRVGAALVPLRQLQEAYPDLKTNENFLQLQSQLEGTENRITVSRRDYNEAVQGYNTEIRTFPSIVAAKVIYGSKPIAPFKATTVNAETAPAVAF
ncbi:LemA protein [Polymorphobacter glacialis]|uniref:LemA protein n=1 Tax=Sandarakinorhabdus glacialis TaxID=1614636 RepID=A0A916ZXT2_9SPHN|nr:LemA family protein [Polymorphobacter glacialis]GGE18272.1 LemA protein [Polymorphobacter glacialis]